LIIDETHSDAMTTIPVDENLSDQTYDLAVIVPEKLSQVWIVTSDLPERLSLPVQAVFRIVKEVALRVYEGDRPLDARAVADVTEDLFPAIYGGLLAQNRWLELAIISTDPSATEGGS